MAHIPREARDGLMRAWLAILSEKHPHFTWIAVKQESPENASPASVGDAGLPGTHAAESEELVLSA